MDIFGSSIEYAESVSESLSQIPSAFSRNSGNAVINVATDDLTYGVIINTSAIKAANTPEKHKERQTVRLNILCERREIF